VSAKVLPLRMERSVIFMCSLARLVVIVIAARGRPSRYHWPTITLC